ncbi:MAG: hypothetical protein ACTHOJ_00035 [Sphingomonas oligoaromativorans]
MSNEIASAVLMVAVGGGLAVHCSRAAIREVRAGEGRSRFGAYRRDDDPLRFWGVVVGTALAALLGLFSFCFGLATAASLARII